MSALTEDGRRWFRPTMADIVLQWAEEPELQAILGVPFTAWEAGYYGTWDQVAAEIAKDEQQTERLRAAARGHRAYLSVLLTAHDHARRGSVASAFSCGEPGCSACESRGRG